MKPIAFSLRQLQYVVAVADSGRFNAAADHCGVSQPALSAQIAELESALAVRIFERDRRRVIVTPAGAQVLARARDILAAAADLATEAVSMRDPLAATLRIGVIPTIAPYALPDIAPALAAEYPRLRVRWREDRTAAILDALRAGRLDAGLLAEEADLGDVVLERIAADEFVAVVGATHPLARKKSIGLADLATDEVLLLEDGHCFRDQALALCAQVNARESAFRATSLSTLTQMVVGGAGVTLLPSIAVPVETRGGHVAVRPIARARPSRTIALVWRRTAPEPLAAALGAVAATMRHRLAKAPDR